MIKDRLIELVNHTTSEQSKHRDFEEITGIKRTTIKNILDGKQRINEEHIEAICNAFPQYKYWLVFGEEAPEIGQTSPGTKEIKSTG